MRELRTGLSLALACLLVAIWAPVTRAQAPSLEGSGTFQSAAGSTTPGSTQSLLGPLPGSTGAKLGIQPGADEMFFGRLGPSAPRVPASITMPGGVYQGPPHTPGAFAPQPIRAPQPPFYGTLVLPREREAVVGPPGGLTLDQAIDRLVRQNLDLLAKQYEIPQFRADVLTASLRGNPILYADSQLIPYGSISVRRPIGPTQYDINVSQPIDYSHKRRARIALASQALKVQEAQFQDAVRIAIGNLYNTYVDLLAARQTVIYAQVSVKGMDTFLATTQRLYAEDRATSADVDQARSDREIAFVGLLDAEENVRQKKRALAELLNLPPDEAGQLELRGTIEDLAPPPPSDDALIKIALDSRPDVAAWRLGILVAEANVRLQQASRFQDAYLLYQPFTYQNNEPIGTQSGASWALGLTVPLPVFNRNQGLIERARLNVNQSQIERFYVERRAITEVEQAVAEYRVSGQIARHIRSQIEPPLLRALNDRLRLWSEGEATIFEYLAAQRKYNDTAKAYLDSAVRHRRSMLALNTALGTRILP
jgi:cobalt-zinc-cadmium efflux system outer membrane protein